MNHGSFGPSKEDKCSSSLQLDNDDPFFAVSSAFQNFLPSTSEQKPQYNSALRQGASKDSIPRDDDLDDLMSSFLPESQGPSTSNAYPSAERLLRLQAEKKAADEDLEALLKETDDMQDIQKQIHMEQLEMADKYREERCKQRRAAAARTRYQRMSENERRLYNHKRRLRTLGVDLSDVNLDVEAAKQQMKDANAKKAEAARMRYHRMSAEQKRDYNMRRTEAFRRRRQEEEILLSTPAGKISEEALLKAQQIMIRNQRKAESARLRYQRMTPDERKAYNMKRASAKRNRKRKTIREVGHDLLHDNLDASDIFVDGEVLEEDLSLEDDLQNGAIVEEAALDEGDTEDHMVHVINEVAHPSEMELFNRMENEVMRRTRIANEQIQRQNNLTNYSPTGPIQYDIPSTSGMMGEETKMRDLLPGPSSDDKTHVIDDRMLQEMVRTGHDQNGLPVEIRTVDGRQIISISDLHEVSHGQTVLITQQQAHGSTLAHQLEMDGSYEEIIHDDDDEEVSFEPDDEEEDLSPTALKIKRTRARRAERARARYHRMSEDQRKEQNAKRAMSLRKARARDDQLCQMFDTVPHDQIDADTMKSIRDAQARRARRALQARTKYQRMDSDQRRKFNSQRDAQRKNRRAAHDGKEYVEDEEEEEESEPSTSMADTSGSAFYPFQI